MEREVHEGARLSELALPLTGCAISDKSFTYSGPPTDSRSQGFSLRSRNVELPKRLHSGYTETMWPTNFYHDIGCLVGLIFFFFFWVFL